MTGFERGEEKARIKTQKGNQEVKNDWMKTAMRYHSQGDLKSAEHAYRKAIQSGQLNVVVLSNLGFICQAKNRVNEAISLYKQAIKINPNYANAHTNLGGLYKDLGQLEQALASTLKSLEIKPDNPTALLNLGSIYQDLGQLDQGLTSTLKSLEIKPDNPAALTNLGSIYKDLGNLEKALPPTLKSLKLHPNNPAALMNLASIYKDLGNLDQALASALKSLKLKPNNPTTLMNLGSIYKDLGNLEKALASTIKSVELMPDNATALMNLGSIYKDLGNLEKALTSTLKSLELMPDNPTALMNLGSIYKDLGNSNKALASALKSLELKPDNPTALMNLGSIYKDLGNLDKALSSTFKSLKLKPDNPTALMNLGGIYADLGKLDQAITYSLKSLKIEPNNPTALMNLGINYETLNMLDKALENYMLSAALIDRKKEESCLTSLISAATILLQLNRINCAKKAIKESIEIERDENNIMKTNSSKNRKTNLGYLSFLAELINELPCGDLQGEAKILHIGESHSLTFTNKIIQFSGKECVIRPSLIKGAKAYHLGEGSRNNIQRIAFKQRSKEGLQSYQNIFLSFGEIDCRPDEGILLYCQKNNSSVQKISQTTATKYFDWTSKFLSEYKQKLVYLGTPAPYRLFAEENEPTIPDKRRLLAIKTFNTTLQKQCRTSDILFVDIYQLTAGEDGYNNNEWMIDPFHLKPKALDELLKRANI